MARQITRQNVAKCASRGALTFTTISLLVGIHAAMPTVAVADEGGVSFWVPGIFGSLAATPRDAGWSFAGIYYHTSVSAAGDVAAARQIAIGRLNPTVNVNLNASLHANADTVWLTPGYTFATPVLGGQFNISATQIVARESASVDSTLTAMAGPFVATRTGRIDSAVGGFGDLYPQASLRWNMNVHNVMVYAMGDIPIGAYDSSRLANLGIGHGAIDGGVGYTYFDPKTGHEFSAVAGLTYNFKNTDTDYRNGVDWHLDWGASKFLSEQFFVGAVGYFYDQITPDSGQAAILGSFESRVIGIGPQIGFIFPVGNLQGYLNVKSYGEFDASARPSGWNAWLTFAISPAAQRPSTTAKTLMIHK